MDLIERLDLIIGLPDGRKTRGLRGHNVDTDTEVRRQRRNARAHKLHDLILHITVRKHRTDNRQRHVLRTHALHRRTLQVDRDHARHIDIICLIEKLLNELRSALTHRHGTERTITRMGIRTQDHSAATGQHLTRELMDNSLMRRYIHTTVLLRTGKTEHVVILIDRTTNRTERIMAVRQNIRHRKLRKTRSTRRLDNTDESNIMGRQLIELDLQLVHIPGCVMVSQDPIRNGLFLRILFAHGLSGLAKDRRLRLLIIRNNFSSTQKICAGIK